MPHQNDLLGSQESTGWIGNLFSQVHKRSFEEVVQHTDSCSAYGPGTQLKYLSLFFLHVLCQASVIQIPVQLGVLVYTVLTHINKNHISGGL